MVMDNQAATSTVLVSVQDAVEHVGRTLGTSKWLTVTQGVIDQFADAIGDRQWIHVDPVRAANGPFGSCVAHGLLTLSLAGGKFIHETLRSTARIGVNYGCERVRFPAPVRVNANLRGMCVLTGATELPDNGVQLFIQTLVEIEGEKKPACVADLVARLYF